MAATIFSFILLAGNPVGAVLIAAGIVTGLGLIITFGNATYELMICLGPLIAPFIPIVEVFSNISSLSHSSKGSPMKVSL